MSTREAAAETHPTSRAGSARADAAQALLDAASGPEKPVSTALAAHRAAARVRFLAMGAPVARDEDWRRTDPRRFAPEATAAPARPSREAFEGLDALRLVFVDGAFRADLSDAPALEGAAVTPLAAASEAELAGFGALEAEGHRPAPRPFAALNGAAVTDGLVVHAHGRSSRPILIRALGATRPDVHLRVLLRLEPGAELTLLEAAQGVARPNLVLEADIGAEAAMHHLRLQVDPAAAVATTALFARLGAAARLRSFTLIGAEGRAAVRNEAVVWLAGAGGSAHLAAGVVGAGEALIDDTLFLVHAGEGCDSRQVYKHVLAGEARGVFQGKILVEPGAQKTDGYQLSRSVLLGEAAAFLAKPELEIYADDVKCSHGSTTGALDEAALFYLRARGVPLAKARALLVEAFLAEATDEIADDGLRAMAAAEAAQLIAAHVG